MKSEEYKKKFGYSKSMAKNMKRNNCSTPDQYRIVRKKNKKILNDRIKKQQAEAAAKREAKRK